MRLRIATTALLAAGLSLAAAPTVDDPLWGDQYGPQQVRADQVWPTTTGAGSVIAVVDSGVDLEHEDLRANVVPGATFIACDPSCGDGDWESAEGAGDPHGTHVAGIAAAVTGNGVGIAGVAPDATILPVKVLDATGSGAFADIGNGIRWAADHGADVINLSLGALPGIQALELTGVLTDATDAIAYARSRGVVVVAAAGNEAFPVCASPSFTDGALCVTATDARELPAAYSNGALKPDLLAVAAPGGSALPICGEDVVSTVPAGTSTAGATCGYGDAYDEYAGTSMAAPHVAGVAALLSSLGCTEPEVVELLTSTARTPGLGLRGTWDPSYGYGIVDALAAVDAAACQAAAGTEGGDDEETAPRGRRDAGEDRAPERRRGRR